MMFFFIFSYLSLSNLEKSDNPYEILGVSNTATQVEIRKAFQNLVKKYHPDRNKNPNAEKTFMKINDAYELLKDPRQRLIYDQTGSCAQPESDDSQDDFSSLLKRIIVQPDPSIETISLETLDDILDKNGIAFVLVHSNEVGFQVLIESFNQVYSKYSNYINFYRNLTTDENPKFGLQFNITQYPSLLFIKKKDLSSVVHTDFNSAYECIHSELPLDETMIEVFMNACFNAKVSHFNKFSQAKNWILSSNDHTRILIIERSKNPSLKSRYIAAKYAIKAKFATLTDDFVQMIRELKLTKFPAAIIFRGDSHDSNGEIKNFVTVDNLNDNIISDYINTLFVKLDRNSMMKECSDFCIVQIGEKPQFGTPEMNRFLSLPEYSFAYLPSNSKLAKSINASDKQFYLIEGSKRRYAILPKIDLFSEYVSRRNIEKLGMKKIPDGVEGDSSIKDRVCSSYDKSVRYVKLHLAFFDYFVGSFLCFISEHPILVCIVYSILSFAGKMISKIFGCCFSCCRKKKNQKKKAE